MAARKDEPATIPLRERSLAMAEFLRTFFSERDVALARLIGRTLPRNSLRDELIRAILIDYGHGRERHLADYQADLKHFRQKTAVRDEIYLLEEVGLVSLRAGLLDRRLLLVKPSERLIDWSNASDEAFISYVAEAIHKLQQMPK